MRWFARRVRAEQILRLHTRIGPSASCLEISEWFMIWTGAVMCVTVANTFLASRKSCLLTSQDFLKMDLNPRVDSQICHVDPSDQSNFSHLLIHSYHKYYIDGYHNGIIHYTQMFCACVLHNASMETRILLLCTTHENCSTQSSVWAHNYASMLVVWAPSVCA